MLMNRVHNQCIKFADIKNQIYLVFEDYFISLAPRNWVLLITIKY